MRNFGGGSWWGIVGFGIPLVALLIAAFVAYWVIRLGVRHALLDVDRRRGASGGGPVGPSPRT